MRRLPLLVLVLAPAFAGAGEVSPLLRNPPPEVLRPSLAGGDLKAVVRLDGPVDAGALEALRLAGAEPVILPSGAPAVVGNVVSVRIPGDRLETVAALPGVARLDPARPVVKVAPLDRTAAQVQAPRLWHPPADVLAGRTFGNIGEGVVVADHEGGWDPFHPDLFRPDAGRYDFEDVDRDGVVGEGDRMDLDGDGVFESRLSLLEGLRSDSAAGEIDFHEPGYQPDVDWLYVDENNNGERDFGAANGFSDDVPAFGEPIFAAEDLDQNGLITPGEKLLRLGTSKVKAISIDQQQGERAGIYRRGENLSNYPVQDLDDRARLHGTGAIGIVAAGWPGVRRYTGLAPGVELLLIGHDNPVSAVAESRALGADINFYEWDELIAPHDGSSANEYAISEAGGVNVAAAGNLAGSDHIMELAPLGLATETARIAIDGYGYYSYNLAYLNLTWIGGADDVAWSLVGDDGSRFDCSGEAYSTGQVADIPVSVWTEATDRGNTWVAVALAKRLGSLPEVTLTLEVRALSGEVPRFRGLLYDDQSGWGKGVSWLDHRTDAGSALSPSTSDRVIAVAAHGGNRDLGDWGMGGVGERRLYSGMGPRLDGVAVIDISGPDDPFAPYSASSVAHGAYSAFGGTSGALPHVAASAALILAERPALGHEEVEALLKAGALADGFTGSVPNEAFGSGKVRVAKSLGLEPHPVSGAPQVSLSATGAVAGRETEVLATVEPKGTSVGFDVGNDGVEEATPALVTRFAFVPEVVGKVPVAARAIGPDGRVARSVVLVEVGEDCAGVGCDDGMVCGDNGVCMTPGGGDGGADGGSGGGDGGCSSAGSDGTAAYLLPLLAMALLAGRRRR